MRTPHLLPALLLLAALPACASRTPVADRIVYRSSDASSPSQAAPAPQPRQPVRQMTDEDRIRWLEEHRPPPPPPPARVVYEVREPPPVRYESPAIWWPPISIGLSYGRHWGHGRWGYGLGLGHHWGPRWGHHGYCGW